jgi:hypothetical protein
MEMLHKKTSRPEAAMPRYLFLLPMLIALTGPALAGPREDTMSGISRCATLPDDRVFLDCIYGAAQPMRSRLGLPPAPAAQQRLVPAGYAAPVAAPRAMARVPKDTTSTLGNVLGGNTTPGWLESFSFDGRGLFTVTGTAAPATMASSWPRMPAAAAGSFLCAVTRRSTASTSCANAGLRPSRRRRRYRDRPGDRRCRPSSRSRHAPAG